MEPSLTSLTYKGSIPEAITEAKKQRKLFVVYISGKNDESSRLENSTWTDVNVADSVAKYCILLHIPEESTDAANFSAIYPQKSIPCTTAIGYNGVQIWQNEGFVSAEVLASSLEKAWLGIHIQLAIFKTKIGVIVLDHSQLRDGQNTKWNRLTLPGQSGLAKFSLFELVKSACSLNKLISLAQVAHSTI